MLVSGKNLSFIHLIAGKVTARLNMAQTLHQGIEFLGGACLRRVLQQPFAKPSAPGQK